VLFQGRHHILSNWGGDTTLALKTKEQLERLGLQVDVSVRVDVDISEYDFVHIFGVRFWSFYYHCFLNARRQGKPVVLSPIFWNTTNRTCVTRENRLLKRTYGLLPLFVRARITRKRYQLENADLRNVKHWIQVNTRPVPPSDERYREMFSGSAVLLVNSEIEKNHLLSMFPVETPCIVVHNAVDPMFFDPDPSWFVREYGLKGFILCVAWLSEHKNQLMAIKALRNAPAPVVFIGGEVSKSYARKCRAQADSNMHFIGPLPQEKLVSAYAAARVHVLASLYEIPGLVSLEAALAGCAVVTTKYGSTTEYFKDMAEYCDPHDIDSIRSATLRALEKGPDPRLKEHVSKNFTWERAAKETLEGYKLAALR
jgi:glycosyltransferase involved in cell wall biosynthesis